MYASGKGIVTNGYRHDRYRGTITGRGSCTIREQCIRKPDVSQGRHLYSQRLGKVEPVFANIRHTKQLNRLTLRGKTKVNTQWHLYCLVHNVEKLGRLSAQRRVIAHSRYTAKKRS
jgi:hypothetical protein